MMCHGCECLILDYYTIFDNDYKAVSHGIPLGIIPGGSWIPTISIGIPWKKVGISMEMET